MLGRLATWLRVLGMDVLYESDIDDEVLIRRALDGERIILTRDRGIVKRRVLRGRVFFVHDDLLDDQLREVCSRFTPEQAAFFSRCLRCNLPLDGVSRESVQGSVPPYVLRTESHFSMCKGCGRIYWPGTHMGNMREKIREILHGGR